MCISTQGQDLTDGQLRLVIPADPNYVRVARTAARGLGERLGMGPMAVEDLSLAIDETLVLILRRAGAPDTITFVFSVEPDGVVVEAAPGGQDRAGLDPEALSRFEALVAPVVDELSVEVDAPSVRFEKRW